MPLPRLIRWLLRRDDAAASSPGEWAGIPDMPTLTAMRNLRDKLPHLDPLDDAAKLRAAERIRAYYGGGWR